jgi:predicted small lipoprotein YifL
MNFKRRPWRILVAACLLLALAACEKGPLEKAGKAMDRAGEKVGDKLRDISK